LNTDGFSTRSTSRSSADATPIVLRQTEERRFIFKPTLVDNAINAAAAIRGTFVYQRKRRTDAWEDIEAVNLASLRADDGVRLDLRSSEVLLLWERLGQLYKLMQDKGLPIGVHDWIPMPHTEVVDKVRELLETDGSTANRAELLQVFLGWLAEHSVDELKGAFADDLLNFDAAIGAARLARMLRETEEALSNADEEFWQQFIQQHSWVISQVFAYPLMIIQGKAYVGGKGTDNRGGGVVDFLYRNMVTTTAVVVEIKTPMTSVLASRSYRDGIYPPSLDLSGATQQLAHYRQSLLENYQSLRGGGDEQFRTFNLRSLLIIGRTPDINDFPRCRSFELFRASQRDAEILSFDELIVKARSLLSLLIPNGL
jgi:Domain of unknown function (DUF4263)